LAPLLFTGLVLLAATISMGLLGARTLAALEPAVNGRRARGTFIVQAAYVQGIGVLAVVESLLAITRRPGPGSAFGLAAAGPAIVGALVATAMITRADGRAPGERLLALGFATGLGMLGAVVGFLASTIGQADTAGPPLHWYLLLAAAAAAGTFALAESGARAVEAAEQSAPPESTSIRIPTQTLMFEAIAVAADVGAIVLTVLA
jgi:hypothetical protein